MSLNRHLDALFAAAATLPAEARARFLSDGAAAIALLAPGERIEVLIGKVLRAHLAVAMSKMSDGEHFGDSELGSAGDRQLAAQA